MDLVEAKRRGNLLLAQRKAQEAQEVFEAIIREYPDEKDGYVGLAKTLAARGRAEELIAAIEPVIETLDAYILIASLAEAYRMGYFRGRRDVAEKAIRYGEMALAERFADRFNFTIAFYLSEILFNAKDYGRAASLCERCLLKDPSHPIVKARLARCRELSGKEVTL